jgi:hypothetical protein
VNGESCRATGDHNSEGHSAQWLSIGFQIWL